MLMRFGHISLVALILLSSTGLVVNRHYCRGELKSTSLFAAAKSCHGDPSKPICPFHQHEPDKKDCCEDESEILKTELQQKFDLLQQGELIPVVAPVPNRLFHIPQTAGVSAAYLSYKPPIVVTDIPVYVQSFLL